MQRVEYEWLPPLCNMCKKFGHVQRQCDSKPKVQKIWVPKVTEIPKNERDIVEMVEDKVEVRMGEEMENQQN